MPLFDLGFVCQWLEEVGPEHASAPVGETVEVLHEAAVLLVGFCVEENL